VKLKEGTPDWIRALESDSGKDRIMAMLEIEPTLGADVRGIYRETGVVPERAETILNDLAASGDILRSPGAKGFGYWTANYLIRCERQALERLRDLLEKARPHASIEKGALARAMGQFGPEEFLHWVLDRLEAQEKIRVNGGRVSLIGFEVTLSEAEHRDQDKLIEIFKRAGFKPPPFEEALASAGLARVKGEPLFKHALETGRLVAINHQWTLHQDVYARLLEQLRETLQTGGGLSVSQIKDLIGASRKYAIPICEHLDRVGYTRREGDLRYLGEKLKALG
jgi:selenocysteine-specific elongation factor